MEITFSALLMRIKQFYLLKLMKNETIKVGQIIPIELTDETVIEREIKDYSTMEREQQ